MATPPGERNYRSQEVAEILRRAQRREQAGTTTASGPASGQAAGLTQNELLETAREVGLDERQVALAVVEYEEELQLSRAASELRQPQLPPLQRPPDRRRRVQRAARRHRRLGG